MKLGRLRSLGLVAGVVVATAAAAALTIPAASADIGSPYFATSTNASDPHMISCTDPATGVNGYCLYTSKDMGTGGYTPLNYYPMKETRVLWSPNGRTWTDKGIAFSESQLSWVPANAYHLWAPTAIRSGSTYYLFVPDVTDKGDPGIHNTSRVAMASSSSPFGPFTYRGRVAYSDSSATGYMSDPEIYIEGSDRYLIWADGDYSNCGGFKSAKLDTNLLTMDKATAKTVTITGLGGLGNCGGKGRPYMEGASIFKFGDSEMPGPYTLVFAAKPESVPVQCTTANTGTGVANTAYEVIAYATASSAQGPYTYRGIIMCGSTTEWTNQATIAKIKTAGGANRWAIVYHDGPSTSTSSGGYIEPQRKLHAACLYHGGGQIAGVYRSTNGWNDCMADVAATYGGLKVAEPSGHSPLGASFASASSGGSGNLLLNRSAVGPWELLAFESQGGGVYAIKALANGKYVTASGTSPLIANSTTIGANQKFIREDVGSGWFRLKGPNGRFVFSQPNGELVANTCCTGTAAQFNLMDLN